MFDSAVNVNKFQKNLQHTLSLNVPSERCLQYSGGYLQQSER